MVVKYFVFWVKQKKRDIETNTQLIDKILFAINKATFLDEYLMVRICWPWNATFLFNAQNDEIATAANDILKFTHVVC